MIKNKLRPEPWKRWLVWGTTVGLLLSGLVLVLPGYLDPNGQNSMWESVRLQSSRAHGALAMGFLMLLGLFSSHVQDGLKARRNTAWGVSLLVALVLLVVTAWGLYYLPSSLKDKVAEVHLWAGIALPLLLFIHALKGRR